MPGWPSTALPFEHLALGSGLPCQRCAFTLTTSRFVLCRCSKDDSCEYWWNAYRLVKGIDIVGDIHGCSWELRKLIEHLDYEEQEDGIWLHPEERRLAFLGDLIDRGPDSVGALDLVETLIDSGVAFLAAVGNHDYEIYHGLIKGKPTRVFYGLQRTLDQVEELGLEREFASQLRRVLDGAPAFTVFPEQELLLVHAGLRPEMLSLAYAADWSDENSLFALYGEPIKVEGEPFPRKGYDWAETWDSSWTVVYGHDVIGATPIIRGQNKNIVGIDTGASYGGRLTALRWPERRFVSVSARDRYPEHEDDFPTDRPGLITSMSWEEVLHFDHGDAHTLHYLHGKRKTPEMQIPKDIRVSGI